MSIADEPVTTPPTADAAGSFDASAARQQTIDDEAARKAAARRDLIRRERRALFPLLAFVLLLLPNFRIARVVGRSMEPAYRDGDRLLLWKSWRWFTTLKPGDVILFHQGNDELVKRVVFVQNERGDAPWPDTVPTSRGAVRIPREAFRAGRQGVDLIPSSPGYQQRSIYVIGDNFRRSSDSRDFGPIAPESVWGKVIEIGGEPS